MKKKTIGIVLAAMLSLGAIAAVGAEVAEHNGHGRHGRGGMRGGMFMGKDMQERLNLTEDQKAKLKQMHQRQREQMKSRFAEGPRGAGHQALMQEVFKDNPNQAAIQQRVAEMQQQQAAALSARVAAMQEFNSILTPAQRGEMQKLMAERAQKRQEWQSKRGERHQQKQQENQEKPKQP